MFAVVRTGGKQYRVAPGDKIVVEKLDGSAGDKITLGDVLLAGDGGNLKSTDGLTVAAEIVAQAKGEKVTVFKKRRRHNYRRKKGHRQQHTILRIVAIGDHKAPKKTATEQTAPKKADAAAKPQAPKADAPAKIQAPKAGADKSPAARGKEVADTTADQHASGDVAGTPTENPAPNNEKAAGADKPASKKASAAKPKAKTPSTQNAAPAKGGAKKAPKAK
jgi:large subunit ribosomal protein L21